MQFGIHSLVWVGDWSPKNRDFAMARTREQGWDHLEVVIFDPATLEADATRRAAERVGLPLVAGMTLNPDADLSSPDPEIARRGEQLVADAIVAARDLGSPILGGMTYSALHRYQRPAGREVFARAVEAYGRLAERAEAAGIRLGIEPVNRYESSFVNTLGQAVEIIEAVGSKSLFVQMDTYHMNIEETNVASAVAAAAPHLGYAHIGESNRGRLGAGNFDFPGFFRALKAAGYDGRLTLESFSPAIVGEEIAGVLALWRQPWEDVKENARHALAFLRQQAAAVH
ncbi:sugar phosphate isomerase/epimerase family protein [Chelativorans sp.]|uniref:sugar phosphate isomerase/epimerase family protein n=1 Tax=Chelativorans sp. TaxID=2203393 RepID=UPI002810E530|nr:sugar phosphate isomerase/epimerase family protein [Chelativorans sp.]